MALQKVVNRSFPDVDHAYTARDTILYALGVGFGSEPLDPAHIDFLFEERLKATPTFSNVLGHPGMWARDPEYGIDWKQLLHAEQRLEVHRPLPAQGRITSSTAGGNVTGTVALADLRLEGGLAVSQLKVVALPALDAPLLGMDVLGRVSWQQGDGVLRIDLRKPG